MNLLEKLRESLEGRVGEAGDKQPGHGLQLAAAVLLLEMEHADHSYEPAERTEIERQLRSYFELDAEEVADLLASAEPEARESVSLHGYLQVLNDELDPGRKREVVEMLWRVAYADRDLDAHEEHLLRHIAELLHLPHREFIRAKLAVLGE